MKKSIALLILMAIGSLCLLNAQIIWELELTSVSIYQISADLHITNNTNSDIHWTFGGSGWACLFMDGNAPALVYLPAVIQVIIPVDQTYTKSLLYVPLYSPIPAGIHHLQAYVYLGSDLEPVGNIITIDTTTNTDNLAIPNQLAVYPNPFHQELSIRLDSKSNQPTEIIVFNLKGQLVKSFPTSKEANITWDGKDNHGKEISNGLYFIKAEQDGKAVTKKVIRIR